MEFLLKKLPALIVDCQTTGASPERGDLLELAWCRSNETAGTTTPEPDSHLLRLPAEAELPPRIARITGITETELETAVEPVELWTSFSRAFPETGLNGIGPVCIAHFARFEERFLRHLHQRANVSDPFRIRFLCTREIARRVLPRLPRHGLRALAGYLGHPLTRPNRAASHVVASRWIWMHLCRKLTEERGIETLDALVAYLETRPPGHSGAWSVPLPRKERLLLPDRPGIYRFLGKAGDVLYVGKAASLKTRVNSYYRKRRGSSKDLEIVTQARHLAVTVTESRLEAALLEAEEIKNLQPPYNTALTNHGMPVWFFNRALDHAGSEKSADLCLGPVADRRSVEQLHLIDRLLAPQTMEETCLKEAGSLLLPGGRTAETGVLAEAVGLFVDENPLDRTIEFPGRLLELGYRLWRSQREDAADQEPGGEELVASDERDTEENGFESGNWWDNPRMVARFLESAVLSAARQLRLGDWLMILSESTLNWRQSQETGGRRRYLVIENGLPAGAGYLDVAGRIPAPPGRMKSPRERCLSFTRRQYDCLSVLTAEIRRLIGAGGEPELVTAAPCSLTHRSLRLVLNML